MRILIIQEASRHVANFAFRESLGLARGLERAGATATVWGQGYAGFDPDHLTALAEEHDAIVLLENYDDTGWVPRLSEITKPRVFWSIDAHCAFEQHVAYCTRHGIDFVLCSVKNAVTRFRANGIDALFFPNAISEDLVRPPRDVQPLHLIGFCGSIGSSERQRYLGALSQTVGLKQDLWSLGHSMVSAIASYEIHFNHNLSDDINYRTFETLGCKRMLLTNYTPGLADLFRIGEHLVVYDSVEDCVDKVHYYLHHEDERRRIAAAGHYHVLEHHTYTVRAKQLLRLLEARRAPQSR